MNTCAWIESTLRAAFAPSELLVEDDSAQHAGHAGNSGDGGHFRVRIVSAAFCGQDRLTRHRAVYAALGSAMRDAVHALALQALTPEEWGTRRPPGGA